jgi:hypothetical protein
VPVALSGFGFVPGATTVQVTGGQIAVAGVVVPDTVSLTANFSITGGATTSAPNVTVTTARGTSNSVAFNLYSVASAPLQLGAAHGGSGGSAYSLDCAGSSVAVGLNVRGGSNVDQIQVICQTVTGSTRTFGAAILTGAAGGTGGSPATLSCPAGYVLTGLTGRIGSGGSGLNDQIAGMCSPIGGGASVITASVGSVFGGSVAYSESCAAGLVMTGIQGGAGNLVDRTQIKCR